MSLADFFHHVTLFKQAYCSCNHQKPQLLTLDSVHLWCFAEKAFLALHSTSVTILLSVNACWEGRLAMWTSNAAEHVAAPEKVAAKCETLSVWHVKSQEGTQHVQPCQGHETIPASISNSMMM